MNRFRVACIGAGPASLTVARDLSPLGYEVVRMSPDQRSVYLSGTQYFRDPQQQAPRPFIDRLEIATGAKTRSSPPATCRRT